MTEPSPSDPPAQPVPKLDYAMPLTGGMVCIRRYGTADEAELHAAELAAEGIPAQILNANVNNLGMPYTGISDVELHVRADDADRAAKALARATAEDMEPAEEPGVAEPPGDENGQPLPVVSAGAYESLRLLREAQTILAAARVRSFLPKLVARGERPAGVGKRFTLSVVEEDLDQAQRLLSEAEEDAANEEPRCPKCGSWRVYPGSNFWKSLAAVVGMGEKPAIQLECLACRYRGPTGEFTRAASQ